MEDKDTGMVRREAGTWWSRDIDVSKAMLDVSIAEGPVYRFENSDPGIRRWLQHMACVGITQALWVAQATAVLRVAGSSPRSDDRAMQGNRKVAFRLGIGGGAGVPRGTRGWYLGAEQINL